MPILEVKALCKSFMDKTVLDGVSFSLESSEILVIMGHSGCGKSVLLKCILGLMQADSGEISFLGKPLPAAGRGEVCSNRNMGMVFQSGALFDFLSVFENIALPLRARPGKEKVEEKVKKILSEFSLENVSDSFPAELSGGMRRRVALARTIIAEPELIMYDEPTVGLDPARVSGINELIVKLSRDRGVASLVVTHDMFSAHSIADRAALHSEGKIRYMLPKNEFFASAEPEVREFLHGFKPN